MKKSLKEMIAIMQAANDGKVIEFRRKLPNELEWETVCTPTWNWLDYDYRVKREPREWNIVQRIGCMNLYAISAKEFVPEDFRLVCKVREVLE